MCEKAETTTPANDIRIRSWPAGDQYEVERDAAIARLDADALKQNAGLTIEQKIQAAYREGRRDAEMAAAREGRGYREDMGR